jgi:putative MATE family efflux protein
MSQIDDFEKMNITRVLLKYSVPAIIATSVQALYNIVDRIYVGKGLGTTALAGVTLTFPIFILSIAIGVLFGSGNSAVISLKLGEKKKDEAEAALGSTYFLYFFLGCLIALFGVIFLEPLLRLVGATEATMPYAKKYLAVFLPFMAFDFMAMGTNGGIRSEGNPRLAMIIAVGCALINIILDPLFLFVFHWGVAGVAWATVISRLIAAGVIIWHFTRGKRRHLTLYWKNFRIYGPLVRKMTAIGMAPCILNLATTFVAVFSNRALVKYGGDRALGALGAVMSIFMIVQTPIRGVQMGAQPLLGYNYGARLVGRVKKIAFQSYMMALLIALFGVTAVLLFGENFMALFSRDDEALILMGTRGMQIYMIMIPFLALQMMSVTFYQSIGKAAPAIILNLAQGVLFYLTALWLLPLSFGLDGVWAATPVSHLLGGLMGILFIISLRKKLSEQEIIKSEL